MVNMKKISMIALTILTLGVTSCDMDKMPYDAVPTEEALTTIVGFEEARAGIYSVYLGLTGGSYVLARKFRQMPLMQWRISLINMVSCTVGLSRAPTLP